MAASLRRRDVEAIVVEWVPWGAARWTEFLVQLLPANKSPHLSRTKTLHRVSHASARRVTMRPRCVKVLGKCAMPLSMSFTGNRFP